MSETPDFSVFDRKPLNPSKPPPRRGLSRRTFWFLGGFLLMLIGASGYGGTKLEENDEFCTSCHLAAERTYYNRAQFAMDYQEQANPDLATYHYIAALNDPQLDEFRCVDCHRGRHSIPDRIKALGLGIYDGVLYVAGRGSPTNIENGETHLSASLVEDSCISCHSDVLVTLGFNNHYHNYLPAAQTAYDWTGDLSVESGTDFEEEKELLLAGIQAKVTDVQCISCHQGHISVIGGQRVQFIHEATRDQACTQCHKDLDLRIDLISPEN